MWAKPPRIIRRARVVGNRGETDITFFPPTGVHMYRVLFCASLDAIFNPGRASEERKRKRRPVIRLVSGMRRDTMCHFTCQGIGVGPA